MKYLIKTSQGCEAPVGVIAPTGLACYGIVCVNIGNKYNQHIKFKFTSEEILENVTDSLIIASFVSVDLRVLSWYLTVT